MQKHGQTWHGLTVCVHSRMTTLGRAQARFLAPPRGSVGETTSPRGAPGALWARCHSQREGQRGVEGKARGKVRVKARGKAGPPGARVLSGTIRHYLARPRAADRCLQSRQTSLPVALQVRGADRGILRGGACLLRRRRHVGHSAAAAARGGALLLLRYLPTVTGCVTYGYRLRHVRLQADPTACSWLAASDVRLQVHCFYRLAWDRSVYRTVREPAVFWLHFAVMGGRPESNRRGPR